MADPKLAAATQLRNIEANTGKSIAELFGVVAQSGLVKVGEQRTMLMERFGLGYGDANAVAILAKAAASPAAEGDDPLNAIYSGAKAHLRPLHDALMTRIDQLGPHERAPKKTYISLRRKRQFAMLGPATKEQVELGLNVKNLPPSPRLKALPPGGMCQYSVRLSGAAEIDAELLGWVRSAYDAAG